MFCFAFAFSTPVSTGEGKIMINTNNNKVSKNHKMTKTLKNLFEKLLKKN